MFGIGVVQLELVCLVCLYCTDGSYMESDLVCLTNTGEVHVYSIPHLRRQMKVECVRRDNIMLVISYICKAVHCEVDRSLFRPVNQLKLSNIK